MKFTIKETIKKRYSVRSYDNTIVDENTREKILLYATKLTNPFGPHIKCKFIDKKTSEQGEKLGTYGMIKNANLYMGVSIAKEEACLEALGYELEELILYMTSLGLGTCWLGGTFNKGVFAQIMNAEENEIFPIVTPVGYPAKLSIKDKVIRSALKADKRKAWDTLFFENSFNTCLSKEEVQAYVYPLEMLRLSPSAANRQPWRIVYENKVFHFYECRTIPVESVDMQRIDMGIALCHFHLAVQEKALKGIFEKRDVSHIKKTENMIYVTSWVMK